ncbi:MAG: hypothetical protein KatS3mg002_1478 [Candidatus Woesearchaeota archaeon]|nr:MAG: hypothetical protein KatS3mg002_1478 [Candidatus Woesearchaeota archaeon]
MLETLNLFYQNSLEKVLKEFDSKVVANKYIELYRQVIGEC